MKQILLVCRILLVVSCLLPLISQRSFALQPPRPGEIEELKKKGKFEERLKKAKALGNHLIDKDLLERAIHKAKSETLFLLGESVDQTLPAPPPAKRLMPTKGNVKIFALLIDFPDYPATSGYSTKEQVNSALFGDGSLIPTNTVPYESLKNFYKRSSYDQLDFSNGVTLGWYRAGYTRASMGADPTTAQREQLIKEAIASFDGSVDFSQFNNDASDDKIELFIVLWTGPNNGWSNFWWAYQTGWTDSTYTVDGMKLGKFVWQWAGDYGATVPFAPYVAIHEVGHGLGLPDYYDYDSTVGPNGGVGGLDMMHGNWGDHNSFSKWVLDWITPTVVPSGSQTLTLKPSGTSRDAALIMPGATSTDAFREFFIAQNRYRVGNDPAVSTTGHPKYPTDGMLIWHVDARLNAAGTDFAYDNSYTEHKLLKLMQADGLDRIENNNATADAAMYYMPGKILTPLSTPNSRDYMGVDSRVNVTGISQFVDQMTATFSIDNPSVLATLTVAKSGMGSGTVTSDIAGITCGSDCAESYVPGTNVVTLTAVPAPGSKFTGWSGGGCSGAGTCTVAMGSDTTVTATFDTTIVLSQDFSTCAIPSDWTRVITAGAGWWWFNYTDNKTGGTSCYALGASYGNGPFDIELKTSVVNLSPYNSVGLEFKTDIGGNTTSNADVDVSIDGGSTWTNAWRKTGRFSGPQTVNVDLSSVVAGAGNVKLRFRTYGSAIWFALDDIKVMASATIVDTATSVNSSLNPSVYGGVVAFTASVSPSDATGTITFKDGTTTLGSATLSGGSATYSTSSLSAGSHSITAVYSGDSGHNASTSSAITQTVNKATPTVTAWPTASTINFGDTLSASTLSGGAASATGTFAFVSPSTKPGAGTSSQSVIFTPADTANYNSVTGPVNVTVRTVAVSGSAYNYPTPGYRANVSMNVTNLSGSLSYLYTKTRMTFISTSITSISVSGTTVTISGTGTVNGAAGYTYTATVTDGSPDSFGITISNGYSATPQAISGGSLTLSLL